MGDFKGAGSFIYYARAGGGGTVFLHPAPNKDAAVAGYLEFGAGIGLRLSSSKPGCIKIEPSYHLTLSPDNTPPCVRLDIGFMTTLP